MSVDRGIQFGEKPAVSTNSDFTNNRAYVIGINAYRNGIPELATAVADAERLGSLLGESHGYDVVSLTQDGAATQSAIRDLFHRRLPQEIGANDRVIIYFAGHGIALDGDDGPEGYLVPVDANRESRDSYLPMTELSDALSELPCRHLLLILDCCFAGAFRWSSTRDLSTLPSVIHRERYERYVQDPAWQVLTSAAYDQTALDVLSGNTIGERVATTQHSPFAAALFEALQGAADLIPRGADGCPIGNGVITATELYLYLRERVESATEAQSTRQTPGLWPLQKHDKGEFILLTPGHKLNLPPAPELNYDNNPYRGLQSFEEEHNELFFGRTRIVDELSAIVAAKPFTAVLGASGTGKSSVVKAGLMPHLRADPDYDWHILPTIRPGKSPLGALAAVALPGEQADGQAERVAQLWLYDDALAKRITTWAESHPKESRLLLLVDQAEEVFTFCDDTWERTRFMNILASALRAQPDRFRLIVTMRSDFEPQFADYALQDIWSSSRYVVPPMSTQELQEAIEGPASVRVLYFRTPDLVDRLVNEVVQTPGAMPLLSFTLSELYIRYIRRQGKDRCLTTEDYEQLGGVVGSLRNRATEVYNKLDPDQQETMRRIMLRMVAGHGGELARRRIPKSELVYPGSDENDRVLKILILLTEARLIVEGNETDGEPFVEPAHDALVNSWDKLLAWTRQEREQILLRQLLTPAANDWKNHQGGLWNSNPRLSIVMRIHRSENCWLNALEADFVRRSLSKRRQTWGGALGFVALAFVALSLVTFDALKARNMALVNAGTANWKAGIVARDIRDDDWGAAHLFAASAKAFAAAGEPQKAAHSMTAMDHDVIGTFLHDGPVNGAILSAVDLKKNKWRVLTWSDDETARVWDPVSQPPSLLKTLNHGESFSEASFNGDSSLVLTWSPNGSARVWDLAFGEADSRATFEHGGLRGAVFSSPESAGLLTWGEDQTAKIWDVNQEGHQTKPKRQFAHDGIVLGAMFSDDESKVLTWSENGSAYLWDANGDDATAPIKRFRHSPDAVGTLGVAVNFRLSRLLTFGSDNAIRIWDLARDAEPVHVFTADDTVTGAVFNGDASLVLSWTGDYATQLWQGESTEPIKVIQHDGPVNGAMFSPDQSTVLSWSGDGSLVAWNGTKETTLTHDRSVLGVSYYDNGFSILSWSEDGTVRVWGVEADTRLPAVGASPASEGQSIPQRTLHLSRGRCGAFVHNDAQQILTWSEDGTARLWSAPQYSFVASLDDQGLPEISGATVANNMNTLTWHENSTHLWQVNYEKPYAKSARTFDRGTIVNSAVFSASQEEILTANDDGMVCIWPNIDGSAPTKQFQHQASVQGAVFNHDDTQILTWGGDTAMVWDVRDENVPTASLRPDAAGYTVRGAFFSHSESEVLTWGSDKALRIWSVENPNEVTIVKEEANTENVTGALLSADDQRVVVWAGKRAALWDLNPGTPEAAHVFKHSGLVAGAVFNGDESMLITWDDYAVRLWDLETGERVRTFVHGTNISGAIFLRDCSLFFSWCYDGSLWLWDPDREEPIRTYSHEGNEILGTIQLEDFNVVSWYRDGSLWSSAIPAPDGEEDSVNAEGLRCEVLSGARLTNSGAFRILRTTDWLIKREELIEADSRQDR